MMQEESGHFVSFMSFALEKMRRVDRVRTMVRVYDLHKPANLCKFLNSDPLCPGGAMTEASTHISTTGVGRGPGFLGVPRCRH